MILEKVAVAVAVAVAVVVVVAVAVAVAVAILFSCSRFLRIRLSRILEQASPVFTWDKFCSRCL